jgi:hypothetical protein
MINLIFQNKKTAAYVKLIEGQHPDGATIQRRGRGYSDFDVIENLIRVGWIEKRAAGPRGGARYFTTTAGLEALKGAA